jgi:protein TonB
VAVVKKNSPLPHDLAILRERYLQSLHQIIEEEKYYPRRARRSGHQGSVQLRFVLLQDGTIQDIQLLTTSGSSLLDDAAIDTLKKIKSFPPIPAALAQADMIVDLPLTYRLR